MVCHVLHQLNMYTALNCENEAGNLSVNFQGHVNTKFLCGAKTIILVS